MPCRVDPVNSPEALSGKVDKGGCLESCSEKSLISFEGAFENVGEFGRYQKCIILIFFLMMLAVGMQVMITYFAASDPPWMCTKRNSTCWPQNMTFPNTDNSRCQLKRSDWCYAEHSTYSVVTQFDLSCSRQWFSHLISSVFFLGWAIGAILLGSIADNYGRKMVLFPSFFIMLMVTIVSVFSPNVYLFVVSRLVVGATTPGILIQLVVLVTELVGNKQKALSAQIVLAGFTLGASILGVVAYFVREWEYLLLYTSLPYIPLLLTFKYVSESLQWLRTKDKSEHLLKSLKSIAYWNGIDFSENIKIIKPVEIMEDSTSRIADIFRTKKMLTYSLVQGFAWFSNAVVYFGLYFAADDLGGSMYRDFIILSIADFPGNIATAFLMDRLGRKKTIIASMILAGAACVSIGFVPGDAEVKIVKIVIGTLGKFLSLVAFDGFYTWSSEIYPTSIRSLGNGFTQFTCRVGAASAPWIGKGMRFVSAGAPFIVMGAEVIIAALFCLLLPEINNLSIQSTENANNNNNNGVKTVANPHEDL